MRCKMKAMIMDMCILSHKTQCFLMFGHVVDVGAGKRRGLPVQLLRYLMIHHRITHTHIYYIYMYYIQYTYQVISIQQYFSTQGCTLIDSLSHRKLAMFMASTSAGASSENLWKREGIHFAWSGLLRCVGNMAYKS